MSATEDLMQEAFHVVLGCTTARLAKRPNDANLLLSGYREDAKALGYSDEIAWGCLFAAASGWVTALVECRAEHHNTSPARVVQELAASLVGAP